MSYLDTNTVLVRDGMDGVHVRGCDLAGDNPLPWIWAEGRTRSMVAVAGLNFCKTCAPLDALPDVPFIASMFEHERESAGSDE